MAENRLDLPAVVLTSLWVAVVTKLEVSLSLTPLNLDLVKPPPTVHHRYIGHHALCFVQEEEVRAICTRSPSLTTWKLVTI